MPFSACTQRTSFPDPLSNIAGAKKPLRPAVVIRRARLLSALGSSCEDTLRQLASAEDLCAQLAPSDVRVPESDLAEADRRIAEAARTTGLKAFTRPARSLRLAASAALPLLDEALQAGIAPADIGLIVGNTAAGTAETVSVLRSHPETEAPDKWMPIEIGAVAALTARLAGISGPAYCVSTACTAGSKAILEGARLLLTGRVRAVVAGGIDAESPLTEAGFSALGARSPGRALPFDARRTGMHLGEGGGFLLMMLAQT
ncbi:beta-ketoacyl synthase N-terminal-like domain-containing protein, partial [Sutterella wadsworthensis]